MATELTPEALVETLSTSLAHFQQLLEKFDCSTDDLCDHLASDQVEKLTKARIDVALLNVRLLAADVLPRVMLKTVELIDSEKPEVARRACQTIMNIAGVPTRPIAPPAPPKAPPAPPPPEEEEEIPTPPDMRREQLENARIAREYRQAVYAVHRLQDCGLNISELHGPDFLQLVEIVGNFLKTAPSTLNRDAVKQALSQLPAMPQTDPQAEARFAHAEAVHPPERFIE